MDKLMSGVLLDHISELGYSGSVQNVIDNGGSSDIILLLRSNNTVWCYLQYHYENGRAVIAGDVVRWDRMMGSCLDPAFKLFVDDPEFFPQLSIKLSHYLNAVGVN